MQEAILKIKVDLGPTAVILHTRKFKRGGFMGMSQEAPQYIVEHQGLETRIAGAEMVCLRCGERIRSQDQVEATEN